MSTVRWWADHATEIFWVEIRHVEGLGTELRCPQTDRNGRPNPWYDLVTEVQPGDVVYHWNAREHRFVGRSTANTQYRIDDGGDRVVELHDFRPLSGQVTLEDVRSHKTALEEARARITSHHPGQVLYLPFQFRADGLRLMSNYFTKLPRTMVDILFGSSGFEAGVGAPPEEEGPDVLPTVPFSGGFLQPFKPKADLDYIVRVQGGARRHGRAHETLVNDFSSWLTQRGHKPGKNSAIDIGLIDPAVVIEAKVLPAQWRRSVREALGQLYEYRYFQIVDPASALIILVDKRLNAEWVQYLERDRQIGVVWRERTEWVLSELARRALET